MSIGAGIIAAVPLQEIDNAPHAQASAQSNNQRLQSGDRGSEKLHISSISPGFSPAMKKTARLGGRLRPLDTLSRSALYIGIRIVHIVVVEDVLVLAYGPCVRYVYLVHLTSLVQPRPPAAVNELIKVKGVFLFIGLSRVLVVRVLLQIVFGRKERGQAPQLQNALIARHGSQLAGGHQLPAQPLGVLVVAFRLPTGAALGLHGDCGLSQPVLGNFLDGGAFPPTQENHAVHVSQDRFGVVLVYGLALGVLLVEQAQAYLTGTDDGHQLLQRGHLARVGRLVPQHPHMMGQAAPVNIVRPFTQEIEHLRKGQGNNEVISGGCVGNREENRRFPIPDAVKLQLVITHDLPELGDVKGGQPGAAGNQNAFCGLARDEKSRTFSSNSKRSHILRTSSRSRRLILSSIVSFAVWLKWTRTI